MSRFHYVLDGIFFLAMGIIMIYAGFALDGPKLFLLATLFLAVAAFFFYKSAAGRSKDKQAAEDLRRQIAEIGSEDQPAEEKDETVAD